MKYLTPTCQSHFRSTSSFANHLQSLFFIRSHLSHPPRLTPKAFRKRLPQRLPQRLPHSLLQSRSLPRSAFRNNVLKTAHLTERVTPHVTSPNTYPWPQSGLPEPSRAEPNILKERSALLGSSSSPNRAEHTSCSARAR